MTYSYKESQDFLAEKVNDQEIYLDNAATTPVRSEVLDAMLPYFKEEYGNPSSFYTKAQSAKEAVDNAREILANNLNCRAKDIIFTSGGYCRANKAKGNHIITSKVEHHAILDTFEQLGKEGFEITYLDVNKYGQVEPENLKKAIKENTIFCSLIYANNEIGSINPISELGHICKKADVVFHTDACQAGAYLDLDVNKLNVDLLTLNGSKIYGVYILILRYL